MKKQYSEQPEENLLPNYQMPKVRTEEKAAEFEDKMKEIRILEKERKARALSEELRIPYINLKGFPISPETLTLIDEKTAHDIGVVCFFASENDIRLGAIDPMSHEVQKILDGLAKRLHTRGTVYIISQHSLDLAVQLYSILPKVRKFTSGVEINKEEFNRFKKEISSFTELNSKLKTVSLSEMLTLIIASAINARASDIHIEAEEKGLKVRFRIDGILQDVADMDKSIWPKVVARIKLLSKLKINISSKPQDGRFTIFLTDEKIDVRVSCLPTSYGESIVMRLLMSSAVALGFEELGLRGQAFESLIKEIEKPNGMVVTTGPTGSGKTTTLYAVIKKLNNPGTKIITIEDPVEYRIEGINQSHVDRSKDYTFANGLRSILRQDPDIVMVGEIRDLETADIAINAALTGHLVLSTIHTNDASGTVPRFLAMGVRPFLLAPALNAMIGQRLVRRICDHCKVKDELSGALREKIHKILSGIQRIKGYHLDEKSLHELRFYKGKGCEVCHHLGYRGRIGIYEIMTMGPEVEKLILSGQVSEYDMRKVSEKHGMITMLQDGILKALEGITSLEEVFRVAKDTTYEQDIM